MKKTSLQIKYINRNKGEATYTLQEGYTFTAVTSDDKAVDVFVFKQDNGTWNATEPQSTANVSKAGTRKQAVALAQSKIGARTLQEFTEAVEHATAIKNSVAK